MRQGTATKGGKGTGKTPAPKKAAAAKKTSPVKRATAPASKDPAPSKSAFIRDLPLTLSAKEVVAQGKVAGLTFDDKYVHNIRRAAEKKTASVKKVATKRAASQTTAPKKTATPSKKTATSKSTAPKQAPSTVSKADFVRARPHLSPREIVEDAKGQGVKLDPSYVYGVRGYDQVKATKKQRASKRSPATTVSKKATPPTSTSSKTTTSNGTRPSGSATSVEDLLRAVAAELGLGRALEILAGERARVRAVMGHAHA